MKTPQWMGNGNIGDGNLASRSPKNRGGADKYYGRSCNPHKIVNNVRHDGRDLTQEEKEEYIKSYNEQEETKDWG